jgi:tetratricopeptide (TPR) repeat protein
LDFSLLWRGISRLVSQKAGQRQLYLWMAPSTPQVTRKIPSLLGLALDHLITANGWTARELAGKAGVSPTTISAYIWEDALTRERLEELAVLMGLGPAAVERAILSARLVLPPPPAPWSPVDPTPEERRIDEKAAAMAAGELMDIVLDVRLREIRQEKRRLGLGEGKRLSRELKTYSPADRRVLIEATPEYQHWGLAYVLCLESEAAAAHEPGKALELAELAVFVTRHVGLEEPGSAGFRSRLEGWCTGFVGNAQRVIGSDLPGAERTWVRVWSLWEVGEDPAGLLSKAYLLDMEASLRRDQRLFPKALKLHEDALALARPEEVGVILLNQSATLEQQGDYEASIKILDEAAQHIDGERQPRLRFGLRFNEAALLCRLGRAREAVPLVEEAQWLAERLRNDIDLIKALWLAGNCAAGLGRKEDALIKLEQVRHAFEARELPFDYALASLDAALLYREEERSAEIKTLAAEMLEVFKAQKVDREAIGAVILFQEAAKKEQVTAELVRRLQNDLAKAQKNQRCRC